MKEFWHSGLIGLGLKKDLNNEMGFATGFAAGLLLPLIKNIMQRTPEQINAIRNSLDKISSYMKEQRKIFAEIFWQDYDLSKMSFKQQREAYQKAETEWEQLEDFLYKQIASSMKKS